MRPGKFLRLLFAAVLMGGGHLRSRAAALAGTGGQPLVP